MISSLFNRNKANIDGRNCAQHVAFALKEMKGFSDEYVKEARKFGSGKAPGNICGAYYVAKDVVDPKHLDEFTKDYERVCGDLHCLKIRQLNRLTCNECAKLAVDLVKKYE